jgi:hypothetical protein
MDKLLSITARLAKIIAISRAHAVSFNPVTKGNPETDWNSSVTGPSGPFSVAIE